MNGSYTIENIEQSLYDWGYFKNSGGGANNMLYYKQSSAYRLTMPSKSNKSYDTGFAVDIDIALGKIDNGKYRKLAEIIYAKTHANNEQRAKELNISISKLLRQRHELHIKLVDYFNSKK